MRPPGGLALHEARVERRRQVCVRACSSHTHAAGANTPRILPALAQSVTCHDDPHMNGSIPNHVTCSASGFGPGTRRPVWSACDAAQFSVLRTMPPASDQRRCRRGTAAQKNGSKLLKNWGKMVNPDSKSWTNFQTLWIEKSCSKLLKNAKQLLETA